MGKQDHIATCNNLKIAEQDFARVWCARCIQAECARSLPFESLFDARTHTWRDRLFEDVPRLDPNDPRHKDISAKRFVEVQLRTPEIRSPWIDPSASEQPAPVATKPPEVPAPVVAPPIVVPPAAPQPVVAAAPVAPASTPVRVSSENAKELALGNTRVAQGRMLAGAPAPVPVKDAWDSPTSGAAPAKTDEVIVAPGARVRLGRGTGV